MNSEMPYFLIWSLCHTCQPSHILRDCPAKKHHCPAVQHGGLIVPHFKCACVRRPEPPHMASPTPPWLIHLRTLVSVVRLGINFHFLKLKHKLHNIFPMNIIILCLSCNFFKCPEKMSRVSCIDFYSGWQVCYASSAWCIMRYTVYPCLVSCHFYAIPIYMYDLACFFLSSFSSLI